MQLLKRGVIKVVKTVDDLISKYGVIGIQTFINMKVKITSPEDRKIIEDMFSDMETAFADYQNKKGG